MLLRKAEILHFFEYHRGLHKVLVERKIHVLENMCNTILICVIYRILFILLINYRNVYISIYFISIYYI